MRQRAARSFVRRGPIVLALVASLSAAGQESTVIDRVLATVAAHVITLSDVRAAIAFGLVERAPDGADPVRTALDALILRQLMLDEVDRYSSPEPEREVLTARLATVRGRFPTDEAFAAMLARTALTESGLRDRIRNDLRIEQYLRDRFAAVVQPTEDDIERYYAEHPGEFRREGHVVPYEAAREAIRGELLRVRRSEVIGDWLDRLRQRIDITDLYRPGVEAPDPRRSPAGTEDDPPAAQRRSRRTSS